jgi:hypothetical protein
MSEKPEALIPTVADHTLEVPKFEGDVTNMQLVSLADETVRVMSPSAVMSREAALIHAAWIVALADRSDNFEQFRRILRTVLLESQAFQRMIERC